MSGAVDIPIPVSAGIAGASLFDADVLRAYADGELGRAIAHLGWHAGRVHEGVHQARKSLRRTRATLALGAPMLGPGAELIDREVRRINRRLSRMRDTQALVETLDRLIGKKSTPEEALPVLRRARRTAAQVRAEGARRELADDPNLGRKRAVLSMLRAGLQALPWESLTGTRIRDALANGLQRVDASGALARASGRDDDWHRWRRRVRRLSQQHRAVGELIPGIESARRHIKALAEFLGETQDYSLLRDHCGRRSIFSEADRDVLRELADAGTARMRERVENSLTASSDAQAVSR